MTELGTDFISETSSNCINLRTSVDTCTGIDYHFNTQNNSSMSQNEV